MGGSSRAFAPNRPWFNPGLSSRVSGGADSTWAWPEEEKKAGKAAQGWGRGGATRASGRSSPSPHRGGPQSPSLAHLGGAHHLGGPKIFFLPAPFLSPRPGFEGPKGALVAGRGPRPGPGILGTMQLSPPLTTVRLGTVRSYNRTEKRGPFFTPRAIPASL